MSLSRIQDFRRWMDDRTAGRRWGCIARKNGRTLFEWYGGGFGPKDLFEIGSLRKSFAGALIGIGIDDGKIDLGVRSASLWPELLSISGQPKDEEITLHHLASGTSGWLTPDPPGVRFRYNNAAFTASERVIAKSLGLPGDEIAPEAEARFRSVLGALSWRFYHFRRDFDPFNIDDPGPKMAVDSNLSDLVSWGELWLREGRLPGGKSIIPRDWVRRATRETNPGIPGSPYGYNWFVNSAKRLWPEVPEDSFGHPGNGTFRSDGIESRTYLWICPSRQTVACVVSEVGSGFANDFLEIPLKLTAEWIARSSLAVD